jgi:hypothetical protein
MRCFFSGRWLLAYLEGSKFSSSIVIDRADCAAMGAHFFQGVSRNNNTLSMDNSGV